MKPSLDGHTMRPDCHTLKLYPEASRPDGHTVKPYCEAARLDGHTGKPLSLMAML